MRAVLGGAVSWARAAHFLATCAPHPSPCSDSVGTPLEGDALTDASFTPAAAAALGQPRSVEAAAVRPGSPGANNPAVARYDPSGLRSAMTTNHAAVRRGVAAARPRQLPRTAWTLGALRADSKPPGLAGKVNPWGMAQTNDW